MLAGDHAKSASDLGLGFVGISLFYREGYFQQSINKDNWQTEYYSLLDPNNLPLDPLLDDEGNPVICEVEIAEESVKFRAWIAKVGENAIINLTPPVDLRISDHIKTSSGELEIHSVNTGVPHAVIFVENADKSIVSKLGKEIRYHDHYSPAGTNVNFVHLAGKSSIHVRTYERGVGETLACGTGVTASSLITAKLYGYCSPISVSVLGGDMLSVDFEKDGDSFKNIKLTGPAEFVFNGQIEI